MRNLERGFSFEMPGAVKLFKTKTRQFVYIYNQHAIEVV